ncbi:lytic murein transglycosylase [Chimaeribacter arupi]|uniref:Lytic murein transglycosylase n=2 Tax=Yersiniaceae TaxID=1903411 RepID=A0A2N5ER76_9GAMM|nr:MULTISPECIES: lytic murein transglycosylase [Yersiniaceae]MBS0970856.1 lytic murein transglycosylase [Nissabacter archeti]MDV5139208.1 lytic murein transglycosylase [Chimaeribacter arupi]PLR52220.1 lytic murein transglycosylase [Chimaeribacter arupi]WKZ94049.1 lytic murein transglycosylase [Chimaeribacter arupi]
MKQRAVAALIGALTLAGCAGKNHAAPAAAPAATPAAQPAAPSDRMLAPKAATQTTLAAQGRDPAEFPAYVEQLKQQARAQGISEATLESAFANIHFVDRVIKSDRNQLEKKVTLDDYLARVLPAWKIEQGKTQYHDHQAQLDAAAQRYGVQANYIVALWGMESSFGKIQGKEDVISALATLAFEGRREAFFTKELMAALNIIQQGHIAADQMKGSWAGAMGQSQFMPTSFLNYGADGDGDGRIDIWNDPSDVFASAANYLATEGWKPGQSWGQEVRLPAGFSADLAGTKTNQAKSVAQWQQLGVTPADSKALPGNTTRAWIITPDDLQGRAFMVYDNFRTIMHWNRSYYFAISIGMMADGVAG